ARLVHEVPGAGRCLGPRRGRRPPPAGGGVRLRRPLITVFEVRSGAGGVLGDFANPGVYLFWAHGTRVIPPGRRDTSPGATNMHRRRFMVKAGSMQATASSATIVDDPTVIAQPKVQRRISMGWTAAFDVHQWAALPLRSPRHPRRSWRLARPLFWLAV